MRTSIDLPDPLFERVKACTAKRGVTLRALVISALERELAGEVRPFQLHDASVGDGSGKIVTQEEIERRLAADRDFEFQP